MIYDVTINKSEGGLGRTLAGDDSVSGLVFGKATDGQYGGEQNHVFYSAKEVEDFEDFEAPDFDSLKYHATQFFKMVAAPLYIAVGDATKIAPMQRAAGGKIRQLAFITDTDFATSQVTALQTVVAGLETEKMGLSIIYETTAYGSLTLSTLPDLTALSCPSVSVVVGTDYIDAEGMAGLTLGTVALAKVSESIGYVKKFNVAKDEKYEVVGFGTGEASSTLTLTQLNAVKAKGYIFLRKYVGYGGTFHSDSNTATTSTSDYATIENVRTIEKAIRGIRTALVPELGAPLTLKAGKLAFETVTKFELLVRNPLAAMVNADEISEFKVLVDADQDVLATSVLEVQVVIVPLGVARQIVVNIGFDAKV